MIQLHTDSEVIQYFDVIIDATLTWKENADKGQNLQMSSQKDLRGKSVSTTENCSLTLDLHCNSYTYPKLWFSSMGAHSEIRQVEIHI